MSYHHGTKKTSASESELQLLISRAGFKPAKRDSDYNLLETEVIEQEIFAPPPTQPN